jgi:hypothetical protein
MRVAGLINRVEMVLPTNLDLYDRKRAKLLVFMDSGVQYAAFQKCLHFVYTGEITFSGDNGEVISGSTHLSPTMNELCEQMKVMCQPLGLPSLLDFISNLESGEELAKHFNESLKTYYMDQLGMKLGSLDVFDNSRHADVSVVVEDNTAVLEDLPTLRLALHNCLLSCRSEYWDTMLNGRFEESKFAEIKVQLVDDFCRCLNEGVLLDLDPSATDGYT